MSMMIVSAWVRNPVSGWEPAEVDTTKPYDGLQEAVDDFAGNGGYRVLRSWSRARAGSAIAYRMEMKSAYQSEHPESNQVLYEAEITVTEE